MDKCRVEGIPWNRCRAEGIPWNRCRVEREYHGIGLRGIGVGLRVLQGTPW